MSGAKFKIIRKCRVCGPEFIAQNLTSYYCSHRCSDVGCKRRKREKESERKYKESAAGLSNLREYISMQEAVAMLAISKTSLNLKVRNGDIMAINFGHRLYRIDRRFLEQRYVSREAVWAENGKPLIKTHRMGKEDCYSIGDVSKIFQISPTTVFINQKEFFSHEKGSKILLCAKE